MTDDRLRDVPDKLLTPVRGARDAARAAALEAWCLDHGFRPSLFDVEAERARRGIGHIR